jgi:hypothetical protein
MRPVTAATARRAAVRAITGVCLLAGILVGCAALTLHAGPGSETAYACDRYDPTCEPTISATATVTISGSPGTPGEEDCYRTNGQKVNCDGPNGSWWYAPFDCYMKAIPRDLWPPAGDPIYGGADPADGVLYWCTADWTGVNRQVFIPGDQPVDPRVVVEEAAEALPLEHATAKIAPGPDWHTYIHLDNWLWVPENQWHNTDVTVTAGPISVTAVAEPVRVEWDMDTDTVTCSDAGRPWVKGMTDAAKTTCSYAYGTLENPEGDIHPVSAHIVYNVTWTCAGPCLIQAGELGEYTAPPGETTTIDVRQRQTVVTQ